MMIIKCFPLVLFLLLAGCFSPDSVTRNIRVTAQAEVDGNIVEGSAVMGVRWQAGSNGRVYRSSNIEAVTLELKGIATVYVTQSYLSNDGTTNRGYWTSYIPNALGINRSVREEDFELLKKASGKYRVLASKSKTNLLPLMVAFKDEKKRETMFRVEASKFPELFGRNVKFLGLWFEFTDVDETKLIRNRLPVMFEPNETFKGSFPHRDADGKLIPGRKKALPQKIGTTAFFEKDF